MSVIPRSSRDRVGLTVELRGVQERTGIAEGPDATMFLAFVHRKIGLEARKSAA